MARNSQTTDRLRPVDLAREHGLSTQAIRNYEADGILPSAVRTPHGYRLYTSLHATALSTFLALIPAHGHQSAASVMQAINRGDQDQAFHLIDETHAQLLSDRQTLQAVEQALRHLAPDVPPASRAANQPRAKSKPPEFSVPADTFIGPLARNLGIRPATLRKWERAGILNPGRDPQTGYRIYTDADTRDTRLAHQLRRGGYPLHQIAQLLAQVRAAGGLDPLQATLHDWHTRLSTRARAMLASAAALDDYLQALEPGPPSNPLIAAPPSD